MKAGFEEMHRTMITMLLATVGSVIAGFATVIAALS